MNRLLIIHRHDNRNTRLSKKSLRNRIKRKAKEYANPFKITETKKREENYQKSVVRYSDDIEMFCSYNKIYRWKTSNNLIKLNDEFSLFEKPETVLRTLLEMLHRAKISPQITRMRYEGKVSFGALYLIDNLCWEIAKKRRWQIICENISETEKEKLSNLRSLFSSTYETSHAYMINERVRINRTADAIENQSYRVKSKDITDMVQRAIQECGNMPTFELPFDVHQTIASTIGEHFDNIILHAPEAEIGILCGFYDKETKEVTLLIYNFGKTISDTLVAENLPEQMKKEIYNIIESHVKKNLFEIKGKFNPENALTLLALQEGVSSRVKFDKSRGHGLIDFIEHCFTLSQETRIVIISGRTAIKIDKSYQIGKKILFERERRVIAMNPTNDIYERPDENYVVNLNVTFPGVLIETTIPLSHLT
mgnify:CR=1 FL=1